VAIGKILVVDDERDIRKIARLCLEAQGRWVVVLAETGAEALERARAERPEVILLDMVMPDISGPELLAQLRQLPETAATPIIFLTGSARKLDLDRLMALGAKGVITKPFDPMNLANDVQRIING
jgi:CheY-like chemotaxis protein